MDSENLIIKAKGGNKEAFVSLMSLYERDMYNLSKHMLGNTDFIYDVVQETIITAYQKIGTLKNAASFKSWLIKILINKCKTHLHKESKVTYLDEEIVIPTRDESLERVEIYELLKKLPEDFRAVLILFYFNDFNYKEISEILNIPEGTVKSRLFRSKAQLYEMINCKEEKRYEKL
ncbi:RNA polymerase sigma factor [Clostridium sp. YIM B02505]|uniref:RNA polymerase sigma factor n=1 Tax=Clostridium yunnanense TaxID=2800325 RepID=A0ABS1ELH8_9CLOT|nr:RNA polymerase sigma factor [Clostridium yunnanense]MBK1810219.1 RNA polymerase sigma factor [Clostridium yunnanense]